MHKNHHDAPTPVYGAIKSMGRDMVRFKGFNYLWIMAIGFCGCRGPDQPDFGRWYRFDSVPDEKNCPQTGTELVKKCPVVVHSIKSHGSFAKLRSSWLLAWSHKKGHWQKTALDFHRVLDGCYRENFRLCTDVLWIESLKDNANMSALDSVHSPGVMLSHASVRKMPTDYPCYWKKEGFDFAPLDRLQNTFINAGTPVYISHYSKDRAWVMIEDTGSKSIGFVKSCDIALMSPSAIQRVRHLPIAVFFVDHVPLYNRSNEFVGYSRLGQVFFVEKQTANSLWILWPKRRDSGEVRWESVGVSKTLASPFPLDFSVPNVAGALDQLLGKPYGWGGGLGNRDCSSLTQDYARIFGYCLPRHSKAQIEQGGKSMDLSKKSSAEKEQYIQQNGIPYRTLLWAPGHVALYVGMHHGQVLIAHAKHSNGFIKNGYQGSHIIGKSLVSTLYFDKNIKGGTDPFIHQLSAMAVID